MSLKILGANDFMKLAQALCLCKNNGYAVTVSIDRIEVTNDTKTVIIDKENFSDLLLETKKIVESHRKK